MQKLLLIISLFLITVCSSCKKFIEKQKEKTVLDAMTDGRWYVFQYQTPTSDVTYEFSGYEFQFYDNGTVKGFLNTAVTDGTWSGDVNAETITANFPSATIPVSRLNGVWKITDSYLDAVTAYNRVGVDTNWLQLRKK
ncbi:MAG TPA: hypothetical protein VJT83_09700 [Chitinophagaceae bacterium]|nr:hypothetical protein [Chitinophagaceae bacterium]